ncbi:methyl-accepting chemotaxis protein [Anaeromicropila populeti]|uniref:Methyl-accepting chemotaxis protein n=1 Tax=Anaeromicropila populeti TaxID=37658 RepID=A0A1I6JMC2_9FIRM|nr:methyl-accepting chemotaxis protein [Anaeromicropila populeti]SFR80122.1 methyl-accepting chemotaxis protein [Anaeromicropila populeti]
MSSGTTTMRERKYNNIEERNVRLNQYIFYVLLASYGIFSIYTLMQPAHMFQAEVISYALVAVSVLSVIFHFLMLRKHATSESLMFISYSVFLIYYAVMLTIGQNSFIQFSVVGVLMVGVLFYKEKRILVFAIITQLLNIGYLVRIIIGTADKMIIYNESVKCMIMLLLLTLCYFCTKLGHEFNHDAIHALRDEHQVQNEILEDVLRIAKKVKEGTITTNEIVMELENSTNIVNNAVSEISSGTQITAENIQEQTVMTQSIQNSINDTVMDSKKMVKIAKDARKVIDSNLKVMDILKVQSEEIGKKNEVAADSMVKLQDKAEQVKKIAAIIFDISSQTNLLALNASIESARAGEAGRGFAVVADQIRQLAEQTRKSTESIAKIIEELYDNAEDASQTVQHSIDSSQKQSEMIVEASNSFEKVTQNVKTLIEDISSIDTMLVNLADANNKIVDNISQLSATSEEITASSNEAADVSENSKKDADKAKRLLAEVMDSVKGFDKYLN